MPKKLTAEDVKGIAPKDKKAFYDSLNKHLTKKKLDTVKVAGVKGEVALMNAGAAVENLAAEGKEKGLAKFVVEFYNTHLSDAGKKSGKGKDKDKGKDKGKDKDKAKDAPKLSKKEQKAKDKADKKAAKAKAKADKKKKPAKKKAGVVRKTVEAWHKKPETSIADMITKIDKSCPRDDDKSNKSTVSTVMCVLNHVTDVQK